MKLIEIDGFTLSKEEWETLVDYTNFINLQQHYQERVRFFEGYSFETKRYESAKNRLHELKNLAQKAREITEKHPNLPINTILKYKHKTII